MKEKTRIIRLSEPSKGSNEIELVVGTGNGFKDFKPRFKFYFETKENVDDFIETLKKFSKIAFNK